MFAVLENEDLIKLAIILPAVFVQYIAALFCLVKLIKMQLPLKITTLVNFYILLVPFVGWISFLIYYFVRGKKLVEQNNLALKNLLSAQGDETKGDNLSDETTQTNEVCDEAKPTDDITPTDD